MKNPFTAMMGSVPGSPSVQTNALFLVSEHPKYLKHEGQVLTNVYSAATDEPLLKRNGYL